MSHIKQVTFSVTKTTPLYPLTRNPDDQYSNVKPFASCTIEFGPEECDPATRAGQKLVTDAYATAQDAVLEQLVRFHTDFTASFQEK